MNKDRTCANQGTPRAQKGSGRVLYELVDKDGIVQASFSSATKAGEVAKMWWPDQEQDPDRTGKGWDVQVVGCDS